MAKRTITIDEKIEKTQKEVIRAKEKYEATINELKELEERKKKIQSKELRQPSGKAAAATIRFMTFLKSEE